MWLETPTGKGQPVCYLQVKEELNSGPTGQIQSLVKKGLVARTSTCKITALTTGPPDYLYLVQHDYLLTCCLLGWYIDLTWLVPLHSLTKILAHGSHPKSGSQFDQSLWVFPGEQGITIARWYYIKWMGSDNHKVTTIDRLKSNYFFSRVERSCAIRKKRHELKCFL